MKLYPIENQEISLRSGKKITCGQKASQVEIAGFYAPTLSSIVSTGFIEFFKSAAIDGREFLSKGSPNRTILIEHQIVYNYTSQKIQGGTSETQQKTL